MRNTALYINGIHFLTSCNYNIVDSAFYFKSVARLNTCKIVGSENFPGVKTYHKTTPVVLINPYAFKCREPLVPDFSQRNMRRGFCHAISLVCTKIRRHDSVAQ